MKSLYLYADYFSPAYRAGGPVKSLFLLSREISKHCNLTIFTRNCDLGGRRLSKNEMVLFKSTINGAYDVNYCKSGLICYLKIFVELAKRPPSIIYLNSFFSFNFSIYVLLLVKILRCKVSVVISPRGEMTFGAMSFKSWKKRMYINFFSFFFNSDLIKFHFTSQEEYSDFISLFKVKTINYFIVGNLVEPALVSNPIQSYSVSNTFRIIYFSRLSGKKNLKFFLQVLSELKIPIIFDIYGHIDDNQYWNDCMHHIESLPSNIKVSYCGSIGRDEGVKMLGEYDLFILPTLNENFGHSIVESLSMGTPVLISDKTPWKQSKFFAINCAPLVLSSWLDALITLANLKLDARIRARQEAISIYNQISSSNDVDSYLINFGIS